MKTMNKLMRFHKKSLRLILLVFLATLLTACAEQVSITQPLKLAGSTTVEPVAAAAANVFMATHSGVNITVRGGGSGIGVTGVIHGALHIGMASRSLKESELEEVPELKATTIGRDGVAVVINEAVYNAGVTQLTLAQVRGIWLGEIKNWQELGGPNLPILAFDKELGRGTRDVFAEAVLGAADAAAPGTVSELGENEAVLTMVSENEGAISILSTGWLTDDVVGIAIVNEDGEAVEPTRDNVASGRYPITRDLNLVTVGEPEGVAAEFIDFLLSEQGQQFVQTNGYTPVFGE